MALDEVQLDEFRKCAESPEYFLSNYVKIAHPKQGIIHYKLYDFQKKMLEAYGKNSYNIVVKFRQAGMSTLSVLYGLWCCMFRLDQRVTAYAKTDREARYLGFIVRQALTHLPEWMTPEMGKKNDHCFHFTDTGSSIEFWTLQAACGKKSDLCIIDEAAFIQDMDEWWKCLYPTICTGGRCIVNSTPNGKNNWFYRTVKGAEEGTNSFNLIKIHYTEHPEYNNAEWAAKVKENLGPKGWAQEVECRFDYDDVEEDADLIGDANEETLAQSEDLAKLKKKIKDQPSPIIDFSGHIPENMIWGRQGQWSTYNQKKMLEDAMVIYRLSREGR